MSLVVTEEMCEIHFLDPVPMSTCSICLKSSKRAPVRLEEERVLISPHKKPQKATPHMWNPYLQSVCFVPLKTEFVHITGAFSMSHFHELTMRLPELVLVEIVPSYIHLVEANLSWFSTYHIGIIAVRRYNQS